MRDERASDGLTRESTTEYVDWDRFDAEQGGEAEAAEQGGGEQGARVTSWWRGVGESVSSYSVGCRGASCLPNRLVPGSFNV